MEFCVCGNMYYISISATDSNALVHSCRHCGNQDATISTEGACVIDTHYKKGAHQFNHIINKYTKEDPTLPRIYNIPCPNQACVSNHGVSNHGVSNHGVSNHGVSSSASEASVPVEVIYIRYDNTNMKYLYICTVCDTTWKTDDSA